MLEIKPRAFFFREMFSKFSHRRVVFTSMFFIFRAFFSLHHSLTAQGSNLLFFTRYHGNNYA